MSQQSKLAVELAKGDDHLDIWVDANNNGVRDDDDVNIYVTASGGFYTVSPTFKQALDSTIQARIKELAVALLTRREANATQAEEVLCELALELVVKAQTAEEPPAVEAWEAAPLFVPVAEEWANHAAPIAPANFSN